MPNVKAKAFPLFYMQHIKTVQYTADGNPIYQLETVKFDYYEGEGPTAEDRRANAYAKLEKTVDNFLW